MSERNEPDDTEQRVERLEASAQRLAGEIVAWRREREEGFESIRAQIAQLRNERLAAEAARREAAASPIEVAAGLLPFGMCLVLIGLLIWMAIT